MQRVFFLLEKGGHGVKLLMKVQENTKNKIHEYYLLLAKISKEE